MATAAKQASRFSLPPTSVRNRRLGEQFNPHVVHKGGKYGNDNQLRNETVSLIGSDKVQDTNVYGADDKKIGSVQRVMIDKISGKVAYAVVSFGGFLGIGEDYYPLPWPNLKYDKRLDGYRIGVTEDQLKGAPKFNRATDWNWADRARDREIYDYYGTPLWY